MRGDSVNVRAVTPRSLRLPLGAGLLLSGCTGVELEPAAFDAGPGADHLPKIGARSIDPTIESATALCSPGRYLWIQIKGDAHDGAHELATCRVSVNGITAEGTYDPELPGTCTITMFAPCTRATEYVVDVLVGSKAGGRTSASVVVRTP